MEYFIIFVIVFTLTICSEMQKERNLEDNFLLKIGAFLVGIFWGFSDRK